MIFFISIFMSMAFANTPPPPNKITDRATCSLTFSCNTNATHSAKCWRVNDHRCVEAVSTYTGASDAVTCTASVGSGLTIDTAKIAGGSSSDNAASSLLGTGEWFDAGAAFKYLKFHYASTTTVVAAENPGLLSGSSLASGDSIKWNFCAPIVGW